MTEKQSLYFSIHPTGGMFNSNCILLGDKETALLTKKVGGMDKQIAKLNKSIEKLTSHVAEK